MTRNLSIEAFIDTVGVQAFLKASRFLKEQAIEERKKHNNPVYFLIKLIVNEKEFFFAFIVALKPTLSEHVKVMKMLKIIQGDTATEDAFLDLYNASCRAQTNS